MRAVSTEKPMTSERRQQINAELEEVRSQSPDGTITQRAIVDYAAKHKGSYLHSEFEWDDEVAGDKHRLAQAGRIMRIYMVRTTDDSRPAIRGYVSLVDDRKTGAGYRHIKDVMATADGRAAILATARMELEAFQRKYESLEELAPVWRAIKLVMEKPKRKAQTGRRRKGAGSRVTA